ncbi:hypothetical protein HAX54_040816 [Datura stramonium]|uniref:Uncharacterized protein n=1 Tax=Datura stramonium TaxID=4076 RepID=A0ABS8SKE2_DATST|nr:hypothetical protein [Datura stramonium]
MDSLASFWCHREAMIGGLNNLEAFPWRWPPYEASSLEGLINQLSGLHWIRRHLDARVGRRTLGQTCYDAQVRRTETIRISSLTKGTLRDFALFFLGFAGAPLMRGLPPVDSGTDSEFLDLYGQVLVKM